VKLFDYIIIAVVVGGVLCGFADCHAAAFIAIPVLIIASWRFFDSKVLFGRRLDKMDRKKWRPLPSEKEESGEDNSGI
jgi:hypothetical protein